MKRLRRDFGDDYAVYSRSTCRFLPFTYKKK